MSELESLRQQNRDLQAQLQAQPITSEIGAVFQALPDLYLRLRADGEIVEYVTRLPQQFYGAADACLGKSIFTLLPSSACARLELALTDILAHQTRATLEYRQQMPTGEAAVFQINVAYLAPQEVVAVVRNVSQRQMMEDSLKNSQAFLMGVIDNLPSAIVVKDEAARYLLLNNAAATLMNLPQHKLIGKRDADIDSEAFQPLPQVEPETRSSEITLLINETWYTFITFHFPIYDLRQQVIATGSVYLDISERRRVRRRLERLYAISHQLNTASDEAEILSVLAQPAFEAGAQQMSLYYVEMGEAHTPMWARLMAEQLVTETRLISLGENFYLPESPITQLCLSTPHEPLLIANVADFPIWQGDGCGDVGSLAIIPLTQVSGWLGWLCFVWADPHPFTEEEATILQALMNLAASVVAKRQAYLAEQRMRQQREMLYQISHDLSTIYGEQDLLLLLAQPAIDAGATLAGLWYIDVDKQTRQPEWAELVAQWQAEAQATVTLPVHTRFYLPKISAGEVWFTNLDAPEFVTDVLTDPRFTPDSRAALTSLSVQAMVIIPFWQMGRWIGLMSFCWSEARLFSPHEQSTYVALTGIAATAVENRRIMENLERAVAQRTMELQQSQMRTERLYQLSRNLNGAYNEEELLQIISQIAINNGAVTTTLNYVDSNGDDTPKTVLVAAMWSKSGWPKNAKLQAGWGFSYDELVLGALMLANPAEPLLIANTRTDQQLDAPSRSYLLKHDIGASAIIPLTHTYRLVGYVMFDWEKPHQFSFIEIEIFRALVTLAAPIVENRRLLGNLEQMVTERTHRLDSLAEFSGLLNGILDFDQILLATVQHVKEQFPHYQVCIYILDSLGKNLVIRAGSGTVGAQLLAEYDTISLDAPISLMARGARERQVILVNDVHSDPTWLFNPAFPEAVAEMVVPIMLENQVLGVLDVQTDQPGLDEGDASLLQSLANQIAIALTNAQLFDQVHQRAVELSQEIQERKQYERALKEAKETAESASRAKSEFLANISHELRTPLNGILGYTQILQRDHSLTTGQHKGIQVIHQCGEHLLTLINDILDLSRIEAGRVEFHESEFNLSHLLQSIADMIQIRAEGKSLQFSLEIDPTVPLAVRGDEKRLRQVIINLLGNAVKFTEQGQVSLRVTRHGQETRFLVQDTGIGIASDKLTEIFEPFRQAGRGHKVEGTGLGLSISKRLVAIMGGTLQVESRLGEGSLFWFELPLLEAEAPLEAVGASPMIIGYTGPRRKILLVDDLSNNRAILVSLLEPLGFEVYEATNGADALAKAKIVQPDVILMDLAMPVMDGFAATQEIRRTAGLEKTVIIAISASVLGPDKQRSLEAGCDEFLHKPFRFEDILALLGRYLQLTWLYEHPKPSATVAAPTVDLSPQYALPPPSDLEMLFNLALKGDVKRIRQQAQALSQADDRYRPFAEELQQLAKKYQVKQLQTLLSELIKTA